MKISFSLNQVSQIQIATVRRAEVYELVRSYNGIPVGECFGNIDLLNSLKSDFRRFEDEHGTVCISIRGNEIGLQTAIAAIECLMSIEEIQHQLNLLQTGNSSMYSIRKAVMHAKSLIDAIEW